TSKSRVERVGFKTKFFFFVYYSIDSFLTSTNDEPNFSMEISSASKRPAPEETPVPEAPPKQQKPKYTQVSNWCGYISHDQLIGFKEFPLYVLFQSDPKKYIRYAVWQYEQGEENGNKHYQYSIQFTRSVTLLHVRKLFYG